MKRPIEQYLDHVEKIGGGDGRYFRISDSGETPPISVVSFDNVPEPGCLTAFSFGLSSVQHAEWVFSRPELVISVNSLDTAWPLAMGELIRNGRERCLFEYGTILRFGQKVSEESRIDSFIVFACSVLNESDLSISLIDRNVLLYQIYPTYSEEINIINNLGVEKFMATPGINFFDVQRAPLR